MSMENNNNTLEPNYTAANQYQNPNDISAIPGVNISEQVAENESFI